MYAHHCPKCGRFAHETALIGPMPTDPHYLHYVECKRDGVRVIRTAA